MVAGPVREAHDVDVALDQAGDDRAAPQVDDLRAIAVTMAVAVADVDELPVLDRHRRCDRVAAVHRVDPPVGEDERLVAPVLVPAVVVPAVKFASPNIFQ